jgi:DNA polymerase III epsilon subunit-like protein
MILFDCETTGLLVPGERNADKQPRIVELAAIKLTPKLEELGRFTTLINPGIPIPAETTKIHGITDEDVKLAPSFPLALRDHIRPFWHGEETVIAYNVEFDLGMLHWELVRIGWEHRFPYCHDIVDAIQFRAGRRISLNKWSVECLGDSYTPQSHRALGDCERLLACLRSTLKEGATA